MFTKAFWAGAGERAAKSAAQGALSSIIVVFGLQSFAGDDTAVAHVSQVMWNIGSWKIILSFALLMAVLSFLTSLVSEGTPVSAASVAVDDKILVAMNKVNIAATSTPTNSASTETVDASASAYADTTVPGTSAMTEADAADAFATPSSSVAA